MIKKSKKISAMSPEEMLADAKLSPENSSRVAQYLFSVGDGYGVWEAWGLLAEDPSTKVNPDIRAFIVRAIDAKGPSTKIYTTLVSLLNCQPNEDARLVSGLTSLSRRHKDSDFAAIMMLTQGTPISVTRTIASDNGMHERAEFKQREARDRLLTRMAARARDISWKNEESGMFIGLMLIANKDDRFVSAMVNNSIAFPSSFMHAVFEKGSDHMVDLMTDNMGNGLSPKDAKALFQRLSDINKAEEIAGKIMGNTSIPVYHREDFLRFLGVWVRQELENRSWLWDLYKNVLLKYVYPSDEPAIFEIAVEELEQNGMFYLDEMCKNIEMSLTFAERIISAAKHLNLEGKLGHALHVLKSLSEEDEDLQF